MKTCVNDECESKGAEFAQVDGPQLCGSCLQPLVEPKPARKPSTRK